MEYALPFRSISGLQEHSATAAPAVRTFGGGSREYALKALYSPDQARISE